jgi:DNA transformation protein
MALAQGFVEHCLELLEPLGNARARRMFGGHGFYLDELFVAIVVADRLYLKADERSRPDFERAGSRPFTYEGRLRAVTLGYWSAPEEALESQAAMQPWARRAMDAAVRARLSKPAPARRKPLAVPSAASATLRKPAPTASRSRRSPRGSA